MDCELYKNVIIENRIPGKLLFMINGCPVIACGSGLLKITRMVNEMGASVMPLKKFRIRLK